MLISARKKDEMSKLMAHTIAITNEMNVYMFEVQVINEGVAWEDHFTASLLQGSWLQILTLYTFPRDLVYKQY